MQHNFLTLAAAVAAARAGRPDQSRTGDRSCLRAPCELCLVTNVTPARLPEMPTAAGQVTGRSLHAGQILQLLQLR